jgi:bacteriocin biosynthesis cyclodehydratase domain-containing protein
VSEIPQNPHLKPWYRVAWKDERLVLEYAHRAVVFEGAAVARLLPPLLPLLDGTRSVDGIVAELGEAAEPAVAAALELLGAHGLLTAGPPVTGGPPSHASTAALLAATLPQQPSVASMRAALAEAAVAVAGAGPPADLVGRILREAGVGRVDRVAELAAAAAPLVVAVPASDELGELAELNRRLLRAATPWLQVLPFDGRLAALGPLFLPGESCCYECYRLRRAANSPFADEFWLLERGRAAYPSSPALDAAAAGFAAHLVLRWLAARDRTLPGTMFALEHERVPALTAHPVLRVPRCSACSPVASAAAPTPWFDADRRVAA